MEHGRGLAKIGRRHAEIADHPDAHPGSFAIPYPNRNVIFPIRRACSSVGSAMVGSVMLGLVQIGANSFSTKWQVGNQWTVGSRDQPRELTGVPGRLERVGGERQLHRRPGTDHPAGRPLSLGDPADADLENAMGSGNYDVEIEQDSDELTLDRLIHLYNLAERRIDAELKRQAMLLRQF